jgi:methylenetetrahydrofolate--tRNA-(uracil-5-)-methyltransferase
VNERVNIIGGGLAGCEAAWQLVSRGVPVCLFEMKPHKKTPAQKSDGLAELVCSNSLRSQSPLNAVGLIKDEMRRLGSLVIEAADATRVPAGDALAVEREAFSDYVTQKISTHPLVSLREECIEKLPENDHERWILATGPLTDSSLAADLAKVTGQKGLYFYDAMAPIVSGESIDRRYVFAQSRYDKGDGDDYLNCPLDEEEYHIFCKALLEAECMPVRDFEKALYFEGCLPIEVIASRGLDTLRFGCMKPVGLRDPRTDKTPHAVVQLRKEDPQGQAYNLVGFQTKMKYPDQKRVLSLIPGLSEARYLRLGGIHRNTYLDSPNVLNDTMQLLQRPNIQVAGQITGVEGYVESAAHGLLTALALVAQLKSQDFTPPPRSCALGALWGHVLGLNRLADRRHEPQNVNWAMFEPLSIKHPKSHRKNLRATRAQKTFETWAKDRQYNPKDSSLIVPEPPPRKKRRSKKQSGKQVMPNAETETETETETES